MIKLRRRDTICSRSFRNMSKGSNIISQRKAKSKRKPRKLEMECIGGPFDGERIPLTTGGTLPFRIYSFFGMYNSSMEWVDL